MLGSPCRIRTDQKRTARTQGIRGSGERPRESQFNLHRQTSTVFIAQWKSACLTASNQGHLSRMRSGDRNSLRISLFVDCKPLVSYAFSHAPWLAIQTVDLQLMSSRVIDGRNRPWCLVRSQFLSRVPLLFWAQHAQAGSIGNIFGPGLLRPVFEHCIIGVCNLQDWREVQAEKGTPSYGRWPLESRDTVVP